MKKMSLLAFVLAVVVLPGCREKRNSTQSARKSTNRYVETNMYTPNDDEIEDVTSETQNEDEDDADVDADALLAELEDEDILNFDEDENLLEMLDEYTDENQEAFNWVDEESDDELKKLYFAFNHYGIKADQKDALRYDIEQVKQLISQAGTSMPTVVIEGHACQEGSPSYNIGLSEKRAKNVADLFVEAGIDKDLIKVIGRGQECPVVINGKVVNGSRQDRAPNRRVEVRVIYT